MKKKIDRPCWKLCLEKVHCGAKNIISETSGSHKQKVLECIVACCKLTHGKLLTKKLSSFLKTILNWEKKKLCQVLMFGKIMHLHLAYLLYWYLGYSQSSLCSLWKCKTFFLWPGCKCDPTATTERKVGQGFLCSCAVSECTQAHPIWCKAT